MTIEIPVNAEYKGLVKDMYKLTIILLVAHIIISYHNSGKGETLGISGNLFNANLTITFGALLLGLLAYDLIFKRLIKFI